MYGENSTRFFFLSLFADSAEDVGVDEPGGGDDIRISGRSDDGQFVEDDGGCGGKGCCGGSKETSLLLLALSVRVEGGVPRVTRRSKGPPASRTSTIAQVM